MATKLLRTLERPLMEFILTSLIFFGFSSFYIPFSFLLILLLEGINKLLFNKERRFQEDYSLIHYCFTDNKWCVSIFI